LKPNTAKLFIEKIKNNFNQRYEFKNKQQTLKNIMFGNIRDFMVILPVDNAQGRDILGRRDLTAWHRALLHSPSAQSRVAGFRVYKRAFNEAKFDLTPVWARLAQSSATHGRMTLASRFLEVEVQPL